tara:strand:- start:1709 stop:2263 length:555 start_codon:yes stop_codon:yes gene_type:complete
MAAISPVTPKFSLGSELNNPRILAPKIQTIINKINEVSTSAGDLIANSLTELTALSNITANSAIIEKHAKAAINSTATATAAQVKTGYITSTSAAAVTITLPTGALLGAALGAVQGTIFELYVDNTAGANTVTVAVAVNGVLSALAVAEVGGAGLLTVPSGATGQARFTLMFSSSTAYTFTRTA